MAFLSLLPACTFDSAGDPSTDAPPTEEEAADVAWYGDVEPIVLANCTGCHAADGLGPFPLATYEDAAPMAAAMALATTERRMPPWLASPGCAEYRDDMSLTDAEIARIALWAEAGAPEGDPAKSVVAEPGGATLSRVDFTLELPAAYTPTASPDDYRCFLVDWPETTETFITGYRLNPGADTIVHHVIAYLAPPEQVSLYEAKDASEEGEGWTCYGGPGVGLQRDAKWLGAWAPGATSGDFPDGTGILIEPGSKVVLQMHYNTATADAVPDLSTFDVKVDAEVEHEAMIQPWTEEAWLDGGMTIPAGTDDVVHTWEYELFGYPFQIHTVALHMHRLGTRAKFWAVEPDGAEDCFLDVRRWDFDWQRTYVFSEPKQMEAETVKLECHWDNPTDQDVDWGEGTGDEMCLATTLLSW